MATLDISKLSAKDKEFLTTLHTFSDEMLITTDQLALMRQCRPVTIAMERVKGEGIPYVKIGRHVRYKLGTVRQYLKGCVVGA